jgi:hypothetical protein
VLYFAFTLYIQRFYMKAQRDLYRLGTECGVALESISKSPILSFFSETTQGITVIRAFNKEQVFT